MSGDIVVGGMHWVKDRRDRWIGDGEDAAFPTEAAMLDTIEDLTAERDASRLIISDLTAEVERLRAAGDALAEVAAQVCPWITPMAMPHRDRLRDAIATWGEARRER